jgi:hypothetical protein
MPVSKKSATCEPSHILIPSNNSSLKYCDLNQFCKEGCQTNSSLNASAVLECEQMDVDMHSHGGALYLTSAFHTFCSEWSYNSLSPSTNCGWAHRRQTSLMQAYKNSFPGMTIASIPAVTMLRSFLSIMYFVCGYNKICFSQCLFC